MKISYWNDTISKTTYLDGKFKGKFFEVYHKKKQKFVPLLYSNIDVWRLRIGKTKEGKLLIQNFYDQSGNLLLLAGGSSADNSYKFCPRSAFSDYMPIEQNNKWGYADSENKLIIPCIYDYTSIFEQDVARVKQNNKWGLIDKQGQRITSFCYDYISPIDTLKIPLFQVKIGDKCGIISPKGQDIIPPIFDIIDHSVTRDNIIRVIFSKKVGYASLDKGVIIPAIYDNLTKHSGYNIQHSYRGTRSGKMYQINREEDGYYEYELKEVRYGLLKNIAKIDVRYDLIPETKRKLHSDDQFSQEYISITQ